MADVDRATSEHASHNGSTSRTKVRRRGQNTVADVREAALTLFAERGYRATGMRDIAEVLSIQPTSIYSHVDSKLTLLHDLLLAATADLLRLQQEAIASSQNPAQQLRRVAEEMVLYFIRNQRAALVEAREWAAAEGEALDEIKQRRGVFRREMEAILARGKDQGRFTVESVNLAATAIIKMFESVAEWYSPEHDLSPTQIAYLYGEYALRIAKAG
jgi:AcrR family transcriptional regulator